MRILIGALILSVAMFDAAAAAAGPQAILQVKVEDNAGVVSVKDAWISTGYPDPGTDGAHRVRLLDALGAIVIERQFNINHLVNVPPGPDGAKEPPIYRPVVTTTLNVPLPPTAATAVVTAGRHREEIALARLPVARPILPDPPLVHEGCADVNKCLKIVFLGEDYTQTSLAAYATTVQSMVQFFLTIEPYKGIAGQMNIYRIDNLADLGCYYNCAGIQRAICCDDSLVLQAAAGSPHDEIMVIVNNTQYGGASNAAETSMCFDPASYAVTFKDLNQGAAQSVVHETAHSIGGLWDEYEYGEAGDWGDGPNCVHDSTCALWSGTPGTGCYAGCSWDGMYRPTPNGCIMRSLSPDGGFHFCPVCIAFFQKKVTDCISGTVTCNTPPSACYETVGRYENGVCLYDPDVAGTTCDPGVPCMLGRCDGQGFCVAAPDPSCGQDAGVKDAGPIDGGRPDAGLKDGGAADAGHADAGRPDGSVTDAGYKDAGAHDTGNQQDGGHSDTGPANDGGISTDASHAGDSGANASDTGKEPAGCACDLTYGCDESCDCDPDCDGTGAQQPGGCSCATMPME